MTEQQAKLYRFLLERRDDLVSPSYQEMAQYLGLAGKSGVHRILNALEKDGRIEKRRPRATRNVRAIPENPLAGVPTTKLIAELNRRGEPVHG